MTLLRETNQPTIETTDVAERRLLRTLVTHNSHVLLSLFPPIQAIQHNLRPRPHNLKLLEKGNVNFNHSLVLFRRDINSLFCPLNALIFLTSIPFREIFHFEHWI